MTSSEGVHPVQWTYDPSIPREDIPFLEDIRRAGNAVRVLRRNGRPTSSAEYRLRQATKAYEAHLDKVEHNYSNPGLF